MKIVIIDGFRKDDDGRDNLPAMLRDALTNQKENRNIQHFKLREMKISPCLGCFFCWIEHPGLCRFDDPGAEIARAVVQSDLLVLLSPVTFGGYSSELKKALDRLLPTILPYFRIVHGEVHHRKRYDEYPGFAVIGVLNESYPEAEKLFRRLVGRNAINLYEKNPGCAVVKLSDGDEKIRDDIRAALDTVEVGS